VKSTSSRPTRLKRPQKYALLHSQDDELPSCEFSYVLLIFIKFYFIKNISSQPKYA
jgi:hypothetical protein